MPLSLPLAVFTSLLLFLVVGTSMMTLATDWQDYRRCFDDVRNAQYKDRGSQAWGQLENSGKMAVPRDHEITVFRDSGGFKVGEDTYIHDNYITWTDPYSLYWFLKYRSWFEQNNIL